MQTTHVTFRHSHVEICRAQPVVGPLRDTHASSPVQKAHAFLCVPIRTLLSSSLSAKKCPSSTCAIQRRPLRAAHGMTGAVRVAGAQQPRQAD